MVGGRGRDRTGDPLLAKRDHPFQQSRWKFLIPAFTTIRGICFSLKANPHALKTVHSCTIGAQSKPPLHCAQPLYDTLM